jgi:hypothetical protein
MLIHKQICYDPECHADSKKLRILVNSSVLISSGICDLPCGVISSTNCSTVTFSRPLFLMTTLQCSFNSSLHPDWINLSRRNSFSRSLSPVSIIFFISLTLSSSSPQTMLSSSSSVIFSAQKCRYCQTESKPVRILSNWRTRLDSFCVSLN